MITLVIHELMIPVMIGVYPEERLAPQLLRISITLWCAADSALQSDLLGDTVDYGALAEKITTWAKTTDYQLIEAFAGALIQKIIAYDTKIKKIILSITKTGCIPDARGAELIITHE